MNASETEVLVENEKIAFYEKLIELCPDLNIEDISVASSQIDQIVEDQMFEVFLKNIKNVCNRNSIRISGNKIFMDNIEYSTYCQCSIENPDLFIIAILQDSEPLTGKSRTYKCKVSLPNESKCSELEYIFPRAFCPIDENILNMLTTAIFSVGYGWMQETLIRTIRKTSSDLNRKLYQFINTILSDDQFLDGVWFAALLGNKTGEKKDIVLLDDLAFQRSIPDVAASKLISQNSFSALTNFSTEIVDHADSVFSKIDKTGESFKIDLVGGNVYKTNSTFNKTLRAVWGDDVQCFPILKSDQISLVCFYKCENSFALESFLKRNSDYISTMAKNHFEDIQKGFTLMSRIEKNTIDSEFYQRFGDFSGAFAGSFFKSLLKGS